jgi:hypothetical protein
MDRRGMHIGIWWEGKKEKQLGKPRSRWEDNVNIDVREIECGVMDWIHLAQDIDQWMALANTIFEFRKSLDTLEYLSDFSRTQLHGGS